MRKLIPAIAILALCLALPLAARAQDSAVPATAVSPAPPETDSGIVPPTPESAVRRIHPVSVTCADAHGKDADKRIALKPGQSPEDACPGSKPRYIFFKRPPAFAHIPPPLE